MTSNINVAPLRRSAVYKTAELIIATGPRTLESLFVAVDFGVKSSRAEKLRLAFEANWLVQDKDGQIDVTDFARNHIAAQTPKMQYIGEITPAQYRPNIYASQGLSKKNIPNRRGQRNDIPAWSVREIGSSQTKA
ncbi:hypothetical protein [Massilia sp. TN1-12]|uniref:hypothetical protein n=1 Tax=Massilia paldalensis TaxID=3377675 RepID=UPI00384B80F7